VNLFVSFLRHLFSQHKLLSHKVVVYTLCDLINKTVVLFLKICEHPNPNPNPKQRHMAASHEYVQCITEPQKV